MQLVYTGPHPEVVVDELNQEQVIVRGDATDIPDDLAVRLLMQDTWQEAQPVKSAVTVPQQPAQSVTVATAPASPGDTTEETS